MRIVALSVLAAPFMRRWSKRLMMKRQRRAENAGLADLLAVSTLGAVIVRYGSQEQMEWLYRRQKGICVTYFNREPINLINGDVPYAPYGDTPYETDNASAKAWAYIAALLTIGYLAGRWAHTRRVEDAAHG